MSLGCFSHKGSPKALASSPFQGCGYPPRTVCADFVTAYSSNGTEFTCYVSRVNPDLVIVNLDLGQVKDDLFYSLAIPVPCLIVSIVYIFVAYFYIYTDPPEVSSQQRSSATQFFIFVNLIFRRPTAQWQPYRRRPPWLP